MCNYHNPSFPGVGVGGPYVVNHLRQNLLSLPNGILITID